MDTNTLKKFAQNARIKLREQVSAKLAYVRTQDTASLRERQKTLARLEEEEQRLGRDALVDKVAYTWFNRMVALRYMDVKGFQPLGVKVLSPEKGQVSPQLLTEAHRGHLPDALPVDAQRVFDLLDGKIPANNPDNEAYRLLLVAACNHLHQSLPFLFERINDYTELLLPDDLTSAFSIVHDVVKGIQEEDCRDVEVIGWLYQFYISEKKDEVFSGKGKVKKEDIPAATQLFTPRWIVEYMVQNTLGKLWVMNKASSKLREYMPYYLESEAKPEEYLKVQSPEELSLLDPACGSGHVLVYAFELLTKIYEEEGYEAGRIPDLIFRHNLQGIEIDERAAQLSSFTLMVKAREYHRGIFSSQVEPRVLCIQPLDLGKEALEEALEELMPGKDQDLLHDLMQMGEADNLGSLITPRSNPASLERLSLILKEKEGKSLFQQDKILALRLALQQLSVLGSKYATVVTNPPYMGSGKMNPELSDWVKREYPESKADLFSCFIERCISFSDLSGLTGLVTMESWMFLSSFEKFRTHLLDNYRIDSLTHFGWHIMRIAFGTVSFVIHNIAPSVGLSGTYSYLEIDDIEKSTGRPKVFPKKDNGRFRTANQHDFKKIPGGVIGYFLSDRALNIFSESKPLSTICKIKKGISTSNNERFLRLWQEVTQDRISQTENPRNERVKWVRANKGGEFQKYYGNIEYVVNWENDGKELKSITPKSVIRSVQHFYKPILAFSKISSSRFSLRSFPKGFISIDASSYLVEFEREKFLLGVLNSKVYTELLGRLTPTLNFEIGDMSKFPIPLNINNESEAFLNGKIDENVSISIVYEQMSERSIDFQFNWLTYQRENLIEECAYKYQKYWHKAFLKLHKNEEELNSLFIDIYGLQDELTPDVPLEDITILKEETSIVNGELVFHADAVFAQLVSYAVGCMFGRYSLDKEGLILANQGEGLEEYFDKIGTSPEFKVREGNGFLPDADNVIPVLDEEWFEDDIVSRFYAFLKKAFSEEHFNENLAFVEQSLGKDIRSFFVKDFYKDHIRRYKKRPIYWLFASPKGHFRVLIYMHRYTPDTLSIILNSYLKPFIRKLEAQREQLQMQEAGGSAREQNQARREMARLDDMIADCRAYERDILFPLATERIPIDLDDGVLVNYNKFGKAVADVPGLNDPKTKEKIREFDWIDTTLIR